MKRKKDSVVAGSVQERAASTEDTPLMRQYQSIKSEHKDDVLLFRLGDFYEMFNDDAVEVARMLNLTLTHRGTQPMCGIPHHAAKGYISRLLRYGKRVAICEQVSEPTGKGLTERKVVEIITPGTAVDGAYIDGMSNNFLACVVVQGGLTGFSFIDVTTADFFATSWKTSEMAECFSKELGRCHPRELLLPDSLRKNGDVQNILSLQGGISISYYPDWDFDSKKSFKRLTEQFKTQNLKSFSLSEDSPEVAPAGFLVDYIQKNTISATPHVSSIKVYRDSEFVMMDDSSRRNLEIVSNLRDGTSQYSLLDVVGKTQTAMGKRLMRSWLLYPLRNVEEIRKRQDHVELFFNDSWLTDFVQERFSKILDVERLAGRVAMERAHAKDLQALRASLESWIECAGKLSESGFGSFDLSAARAIADLVSNSILDDPATSLTEGRIIKPGWSSELDGYRDLHDNANRILEEYAAEEQRNTGIANLRIKYNNLSGYYIEVTRGKVDKIPDHFIMRRSMTNADRFTTERLQKIERDINEAEAKIVETEKVLFLEIRSKIAECVPYLLETARNIAYADVSSTLARSALVNKWVRPVVDDGEEFDVRAGRHPVVEAHLPAGEFVPNDLSVSSSENGGGASFALITGPNMAGKSTYLRQTALIALMAQIGSFVPADSAHIGVVDRIFCRVGASDNLAKGESTFLVEMTETAYILRSATRKSLVIMDEVGRGTSTEDGLSIAWAVSEYLLNTLKCKTLFATHYHELTRMEHDSLKLMCMAVSEEDGRIVFLRKIKEGASENSYGIHVASLAGVPCSVIDRANEILSGLQKAAESGSGVVIETSKESADDNPKLSLKMPGLFSEEELILEEILSVDTDEITAKQALQMIDRWKMELTNR